MQRFGNDQEKEGEGYIQIFDLGDCHSLKRYRAGWGHSSGERSSLFTIFNL